MAPRFREIALTMAMDFHRTKGDSPTTDVVVATAAQFERFIEGTAPVEEQSEDCRAISPVAFPDNDSAPDAHSDKAAVPTGMRALKVGKAIRLKRWPTTHQLQLGYFDGDPDRPMIMLITPDGQKPWEPSYSELLSEEWVTEAPIRHPRVR